MAVTRGKVVAGSTREIRRSSRFEGVGLGPRLSRVRLLQNFMCRPFVLNGPHPAVLGQLATRRSDDFGRLAPPSKQQVPVALFAPATDRLSSLVAGNEKEGRKIGKDGEKERGQEKKERQEGRNAGGERRTRAGIAAGDGRKEGYGGQRPESGNKRGERRRKTDERRK